MDTPATPRPSDPPAHTLPLWERLARLGRPRLSAIILLFSLLVLTVAWGAVYVELRMQRADNLRDEARQNTNLAHVLQEQTVRVLAAVDQSTLRLSDAVRQGHFKKSDFERIADATGLVPDILTQLSLVGPDGRFIGSNLDPLGRRTGGVDLSDREHIQAHLAPHLVPDVARQFSRDGLFIGKPVLGKVSGKWTIQLTRRIIADDGRVLGVVVASLNPLYFEQVYSQVQLGERAAVSLVGEDRVVRARVVDGRSSGTGSVLGGNSYIGTGRLGQQGTFIRTSGIDGVERLFAYRRVGDYPLVVMVASTTQTALRDWHETRNVAVVLATLFSLAVLGAALLFLRSVRQLEATNRALQLSEAQAQSANQAKTEFLAAISHELRTPLTSIRGFSELMELRLTEAKYREQAGLIRKASEHLNALLTEILDLSKIEAGAMTLQPEPHNLAELLQATMDFFALTAASKGLALTLHIDPQVPQALVCDGLRLKQILNNLLSNALKFTAQGSVKLTVEVVAGDVAFHVADTGPGIPKDMHEAVFEKFRQGHARVSYEHGGTGLGLALARSLAELMGGRLTVQSVPGQGACFTLRLPLQAPTASQSAA